jgi:hypothetical protein
VYLAVAAAALVVHLGALANGYAMDDVFIVALDPRVHHWSGIWRAFLEPYWHWPASFGAAMYRPLVVASFTLDHQLDHVVWLHAVNLLWHAGASVAVAAMLERWTESAPAALLAGILFAVHPVHVEAVANLVGRSELMATVFTLLAVYIALVHDRLWWSLGALCLGLLSKENAAIAPGLIVWGWVLGLGRVSHGRRWAYAAGWAAVAVVYFVVRESVLSGQEPLLYLAPVFRGAGPLPIRLTAVAALTDVTRLLLFPLTLRVDYSPAERTLVASPIDPRFLIGLACCIAWGALVWIAWRRSRRVEAFGLGWVGLALLPSANFLFPTGVFLAERSLYLPSAGLALAVGAALAGQPRRRLALITAAVLVLGGARSFQRVPVWRSTLTATLSVFDDSPRSYVGPAGMLSLYLEQRQPQHALAAFRVAAGIYDQSPLLFVQGADAAFALGQPALADSLLERMERVCERCPQYYQAEIAAAQARRDSTSADSLLVRLQRRGLGAP